jgi:hypothetical protein
MNDRPIEMLVVVLVRSAVPTRKPRRWARVARTVAEYGVTIGVGILASYAIVHAGF